MTTAIILAAGKSERMGGNVDKTFLSLGNKPVLAWSLLAFERSRDIDRIVLVVRKEQQVAAQAMVKMFGISKLQKIVAGGKNRQASVQEGIKASDPETKYVIIHDAARPMVTSELVTEIVKYVKRYPAVTVARPVTDTIKECGKGIQVEKTLDRSKLWAVQTPQAFEMKELRAAYRDLGDAEITDDCQALEKKGVPVRFYEYLKPNFKITVPDDLQLISALMK